MKANRVKFLLTAWERFSLKLQHTVAQMMMPLTYLATFFWLKVGRGYRIPQLTEFRKAIDRVFSARKGPILICPNHLTMIDSLILMWAMSSGWKAVLQPTAFPWNTPEKRNFGRNFLISAFCYFGKCLQILRQGPQDETKKFMNRVKYLFSRGQTLMIFPEGTRSRSGKVDTENFTYGVGKIVDEVRQEEIEPHILCVYMRGENQKAHSFFPKKGERFFLDFKLVDPRTQSSGLRAARDIASRIMQQLSELEANYFARKKPLWQ